MSSSREESPGWLRSFQAMSQSVMTLLSGSESPLDGDGPMSDDEDQTQLSILFKKDPEVRNDQDSKESPVSRSSKAKSLNKTENVEHTPGRKRKRKDLSGKEEEKDDERVVKRKQSEKPKPQEPNHSIWTLSSDSESSSETSLVGNDNVHDKELCPDNKAQHVLVEEVKVAAIDKDEVSPYDKAPVLKSPKKQLKKDDDKSVKKKEENIVVKENDGQIDVGDEVIPEKQEGPQVSSSRLPLVLFKKVQRSKIEAIMNDFIQLNPQSDVYEAETAVEGTLDGFTFDSEEEADNLPKAMDQDDKIEAGEGHPKGKTKGKAEKTKQAAGKKAKTGGKLSKKVSKKTQAPKKSKAKK